MKKGIWLCSFLVTALELQALTPCSRWGAGLSRPQPFPPPAEDEYRLVARAGKWAALVSVPMGEVARPTQAQVSFFHRGKLKEERFLDLRGRLGEPLQVGGPEGATAVGWLGAFLSPTGEYLALQSPEKILIFDPRGFFGEVPSSPVTNLLLTSHALFTAVLASKPGEPLLFRWELEDPPRREVVAEQGEERPTHLLLAVRADGFFWAVDMFSGQAWLYNSQGVLKKRFPPPPSLGSQRASGEEMTERAQELEKRVALLISDATRKPPEVKTEVSPWEEVVASISAMGQVLVVQPSRWAERLYLLDEEGKWHCGEVEGPGGIQGVRGEEEGLWVFFPAPQGGRFFPREHLLPPAEEAKPPRSPGEGAH